MFKKTFEIREHAGAVFSLTTDSTFVYSASADKFVTRWNKNTGEQDSFAIQCDSSIYKILLLNKLDLLVIGTSKGDVHIIDTLSKQELKFLKYHKVAIFEIQYDENRNRLYVGDADGNFTVWDTLNWKLVISLPFDCGKIRAIQLVEDFGIIVLGSQDGKIRVIELDTFNLISTLEGHQGGCLSLLYSPFKRNVLFTAGKDGYIRAWNLLDYKLVVSIPAHNEAVYKLKISNKSIVSVSRDKNIKFWDVNSLDFEGKIDRKQGSHSHSINDIVVIQNSIFTAGDDKRIIRWDHQSVI